jgi:hypothetical protein
VFVEDMEILTQIHAKLVTTHVNVAQDQMLINAQSVIKECIGTMELVLNIVQMDGTKMLLITHVRDVTVHA